MTAWDALEDRVRAYATRHGLGPTELARRLGYEGSSRSWGSAFMKGQKGLTADRLELIARLMGTTVAGLFAEYPSDLSPDAVEVAAAYEACTSTQIRNTVRVALNLPLPPATDRRPARGEEQNPSPAFRRRAGHAR